jgi:magnesium transporter
MIERYQNKHVAWVDLESPSPEEIRATMEEYNIPPQLLGDLSGPVPRSEAAAAEHAIKITIDFPVVKKKAIESSHEIKFIISKKTLVTVRYEDVSALHRFSKEFEVLSTLDREMKETSGGLLFVALMRSLYDGLASKLDYIDSRMDYIEEQMFDEREREMVVEISKASQTLITFKQILFSHKEVLDVARPMFLQLFGKSFEPYLVELFHHYQYLARRTSSLSASLQELRDTNDSLLSTKQNETMKVLTIMAFVTFPLTLISSVFGMNTASMPIVGNPFDFWIISGIMCATGLLFFAYFKYKRWF